MKILLIQPTGDKRGHYGIYTTHVCQGLAARGNDVTLFTNCIHPELYLEEKPLFKSIEWHKDRLAFDRFDAAKTKHPLYYNWGYLRNCFSVVKAGLQYAQGKGYDVVQLFDTEYGIASILIRLYGKRLPVVLMVNAPNFSYKEYIGSVVVKVYKGIQRRMLKPLFGTYIKGVNMLGAFHAREMRRQFALPDSFPIAVIYDGADAPKIIYTKAEARARLGIDYTGTLFLFFGMLRRDKGIEYFFEAIGQLPKLDFKVLVAGSLFDYTEQEITTLIERCGIKDRVITNFSYIPNEEMYTYFFASDVLVLPYVAQYRGGSGPLLKEAAICNVPAIVSDVSEMGPLVKKYDMGLTALPENATSLAAALAAFMQLPAEEKIRKGENARKAANTWDKMAQDYEEFYKKI